MPRTSRRRAKAEDEENEEDPPADAPVAGGRQLPAHVRNRQRAIAEREAARLARPEQRKVSTLGHADRKKSAVTSTPFGILASSSNAAGPKDSTWCGPFTVARQMIAAREEAKRKREEEAEDDDKDGHHPLDEMMQQIEQEKRQKAHPSLLWKSRCVTPDQPKSATKSKKPRLPPSQSEQTKHKVPSLYQLCVNFVVDNFEHVESLGSAVGHDIRTSIAHALASQNRLNSVTLAALIEPDMESLELVDCADISQEALCEALHQAPTLRYLRLDQAGRCMGKTAVETLLNPYAKHATEERPVPLFALHIGGAYLWTDADAGRILRAMAPTLQSLAFKACPLLGLELCKTIPQVYQRPPNTILELSLEDMTLTRESWEALTGNPTDDEPNRWQRNLKSLALKRMTNLQDDLVIALLQGAPDLEHLDLSDNHELTDATLSALRFHETSHLRSLNLSNLKQLTSLGLETLFTQGLEGMGPPPQLKILQLSHLHVDAVTDSVMELVLQSASRKPMAGTSSTPVVAEGLSLLGGMVRLEVQGSAITDNTLEQIAATSASTLEHLNVSFCPHISDKGLGYLVDTVKHQLESVQIWGCAQITEEFWNGHSRTGVVEGNKADGVFVPLQITGAWMKKSGVSSIR